MYKNKKKNGLCKLIMNRCVKRMLFCPGSGQELLSGFVVTKVCHDSNVFLIRKLPLSIKEALLKSIGMFMGPGMVHNSGAFSSCFEIFCVFFSSGAKRSASFTDITP